VAGMAGVPRLAVESDARVDFAGWQPGFNVVT
jgi:hypothetical protein